MGQVGGLSIWAVFEVDSRSRRKANCPKAGRTRRRPSANDRVRSACQGGSAFARCGVEGRRANQAPRRVAVTSRRVSGCSTAVALSFPSHPPTPSERYTVDSVHCRVRVTICSLLAGS